MTSNNIRLQTFICEKEAYFEEGWVTRFNTSKTYKIQVEQL